MLNKKQNTTKKLKNKISFLEQEMKKQSELLCAFVSQNCTLININQKLTNQLFSVGVVPDNKK